MLLYYTSPKTKLNNQKHGKMIKTILCDTLKSYDTFPHSMQLMGVARMINVPIPVWYFIVLHNSSYNYCVIILKYHTIFKGKPMKPFGNGSKLNKMT